MNTPGHIFSTGITILDEAQEVDPHVGVSAEFLSGMMTDKNGNWVGWTETWRNGESIAQNPTLVTKDYVRAAECFGKAAAAQHPEGQCGLGQCYMDGKVRLATLEPRARQ